MRRLFLLGECLRMTSRSVLLVLLGALSLVVLALTIR